MRNYLIVMPAEPPLWQQREYGFPSRLYKRETSTVINRYRNTVRKILLHVLSKLSQYVKSISSTQYASPTHRAAHVRGILLIKENNYAHS